MVARKKKKKKKKKKKRKAGSGGKRKKKGAGYGLKGLHGEGVFGYHRGLEKLCNGGKEVGARGVRVMARGLRRTNAFKSKKDDHLSIAADM